MEGRLQGKVAVVTGGASGMGLATVERFVAEGAQVVFCDLTPEMGRSISDTLGDTAKLHYSNREEGGENDGETIAKRLGNAAAFVAADVTDKAHLKTVIDTAVERFGGLDIMFNNAGVGTREGRITDCPDEVFDRVIAVNLKAVWYGIKLSAPHIAKRRGGSIINTASISALLGLPGQGAYGASKGGVVQLTRVAAIELARSFVRVNAICPGGIGTPLIYQNPGGALQVEKSEIDAMLMNAQPIPRAGRPDDIANAALWLASDESSFVTGHSLVVDGGIVAEFGLGGRQNELAAALPTD